MFNLYEGLLTFRGPMKHNVHFRQLMQRCGNSGEAIYLMSVITGQAQERPHFSDILVRRDLPNDLQ